MFNLIQTKFQKSIIAFAVLAVVSGGAFVSTPQAHAQSQQDLTALINSLMKQIVALQAQLQQRVILEGGTGISTIMQGDEVTTTDNLKVRTNPYASANEVSVQRAYSKGKIIGGPEVHEGYTWYKIKYADGSEGWSVANWLQKVAVSKSTNVTETKAPTNKSDVININFVGTANVASESKVPVGDKLEIRADVFNPQWNDKYRYILHFGDGTSTLVPKKTSTKAGISTTHQYKKAGTYKVTLTYTNWGSTDPNDDTYGVEAMKDVTNERNTVAASKTIVVTSVTEVVPVVTTNGSEASCTVKTDKASYQRNETILFDWDSQNAERLEFVLTDDSKINFIAFGTTVYKKGSAQIGATFTGTEVIKMRTLPTAASSKVAECQTTITAK